MGNDRSDRGRIVSIDLLRRLAARRSAASPDSPQAAPEHPLPDDNLLEDAIRRLEEGISRAPYFGSRRRKELLARLRADIEKLPDVRPDRVIEAKLRISSGYYDNDEVRREILRSILESIIPPHILEEPRPDPADDPRKMDTRPSDTDRGTEPDTDAHE